jgi:hypothetical protein
MSILNAVKSQASPKTRVHTRVPGIKSCFASPNEVAMQLKKPCNTSVIHSLIAKSAAVIQSVDKSETINQLSTFAAVLYSVKFLLSLIM